jgi:hypothetical protein
VGGRCRNCGLLVFAVGGGDTVSILGTLFLDDVNLLWGMDSFHIAHIEHGVRDHGDMDRRVLPVVLHEGVGAAVDVEVGDALIADSPNLRASPDQMVCKDGRGRSIAVCVKYSNRRSNGRYATQAIF